jgi:Chaperone of endosialidase
MNTQSEKSKQRRKWETPAISMLAFRDTRVKAITTTDGILISHNLGSLLHTISDVRVKRDIVAVGQLDNGIGIYRYRYLGHDRAYAGVIAQEVAQIVPEAVAVGVDGYLRVDYARLGRRLMTWEEWSADAERAVEAGAGGDKRSLN